MKFSEILNKDPKITNLSNKDMTNYRNGLAIMSKIADDLIDIDLIPDDKFSKEGYFYDIPFLHSEILYDSGNSIDLLIVYHIERNQAGNISSSCPLRIDFKYNDNSITIHNQTIQDRHINKRIIVCKTNDGYKTGFTNLKALRLSEIIKNWNIQAITAE